MADPRMAISSAMKPGWTLLHGLILTALLVAMGCRGEVETTGLSEVALGSALEEVSGLNTLNYVMEWPGHEAAVLIPDPMVPGLTVVDFDRSETRSVGRTGQGPGEFRAPANLAPFRGERVAVIDGLGARVTILDSNLGLESIRRIPNAVNPFRLQVDSMGRILSVPAGRDSGDSIPLLHGSPESSLDTVAWVQRLDLEFVPIGDGGMMIPPEYEPRDLWGMHPGGEIWIARGERREVELISSSSSWSVGFPMPPIETVPEDLKLFRGLPTPADLQGQPRKMAEVKGPFQEVRAGKGGELWFWLNQPSGYTEERYAVLSPKGEWRGIVVVPSKHRVVGVGEGHIFLASEAEDGSWTLSRHERPFLEFGQ